MGTRLIDTNFPTSKFNEPWADLLAKLFGKDIAQLDHYFINLFFTTGCLSERSERDISTYFTGHHIRVACSERFNGCGSEFGSKDAISCCRTSATLDMAEDRYSVIDTGLCFDRF